MQIPKKVLMASPKYFAVEYAINPHMKSPNGELHIINKTKSLNQWNSLRATYNSLGLHVETLEAIPGLPDLVFSANQTLPIVRANEKICILSNMANPQREGEVPLFRTFFESQNYQIHSTQWKFEGAGDALIDYGNDRIFLGHGFRTSPEVADFLSEVSGLPVIQLQLIEENFYHLDTCLCLLNAETVAVVESGFQDSSLNT